MEAEAEGLIEFVRNAYSSKIEVLNYSDGEVLDYPFVLLECQFKSDTKLNNEDETMQKSQVFPIDDRSFLENREKVFQVSVETRNKCRTWPVIRGAFKSLVLLVPGENNIKITGSIGEKCVIQKDFHLVYHPSTLPRFVRVVYVKCKDSNGSFEAPPEVNNDIEVAKKKLAFNARLLQAFTAQDLHKHGFGHRTFRLEETDEGEPLVHVFTSSLTTEEAWKMSGGELYKQFSTELRDSCLYSPLCKFWTFMSCTHYDPPPPEEFDEKDIHLYVKAHTALGGGNLALFGTGGLHTWATNVDELVSCFTNSRKIDRRSLFDDSCRRGFHWANYATGLGASMHELGHCFDLAHTPQGIMGRGFDDLNCIFSLWKNPQHSDNEGNGLELLQAKTESETSTPNTNVMVHSDQSQETSLGNPKGLATPSLDDPSSHDAVCANLALPGDDSHGAKWYRSSAVLLQYHKWFSSNVDSDEKFINLPIIHWGRHFFGPLGIMSAKRNLFFNDQTWLSRNNAQFGGFVIHADIYVNCIQTIGLALVDQDGVDTMKEILSEPRGREGVGRRYVFRLEHPDEHLTAIDLRAGAWIDALRVHTNYKSSLWIGGKGGSLCHFEPRRGQKMVGTFGCGGNYVESLGFFLESFSTECCTSDVSEPQDDEELIVEAPNGLRLIELQNKSHGEVCKHWEFLEPCPPTRFCLDREDIIMQEATILVEDALGNIHRSGPFYEFDKLTDNDSDDEHVVDNQLNKVEASKPESN